MGKNHISTETVIYEDKDDTKHSIRTHLDNKITLKCLGMSIGNL